MLTDTQRRLCNATTWWTITNPPLIVDAFLVLKLDLPKPVLFSNLSSDLGSLIRSSVRTSPQWYEYFMGHYQHYSLTTLRSVFGHPPYVRRTRGLRPQLSSSEIIRKLPVVRKIVEENPRVASDRVSVDEVISFTVNNRPAVTLNAFDWSATIPNWTIAHGS